MVMLPVFLKFYYAFFCFLRGTCNNTTICRYTFWQFIYGQWRKQHHKDVEIIFPGLVSLTSFMLMFFFLSNLLGILHQLVHDVKELWYKGGNLAWNELTFFVLGDEGDPFPIFILYPVKPVKVFFFHLNWNSTLHKKWSFSLRISSFFMQYYWPHVAQCEPVYFFLFPNNTVDFWTTSFKLTLL